MSKRADPLRWSKFAFEMEQIKEKFPEHAREIERAVGEAVRKLDSCGDPNCTCRLKPENYRAFSLSSKKFTGQNRTD
jgi:hypothetical protein